MEWLELNQVDARERYESLLENDFRDSYILSTLTSQSEKKLRYQLTDAYEEIISQINDGINNGKLNYSKKKYYTDCYFGIELFKILRSFKFQLHDASNINIWRYISLYIIPDLVLERHGQKEKYFYSIPNKNKSQCSLLKKTCSLTLNHTHKNARIIINTDTPGGCPTKGARHESRTAEY